MKPSFAAAVLALLLGLVLCAAAGDPAPTSPQPELEQLHREVQRPVDSEDPFEDGRIPDLVLLSTTDVNGETAPCG